MIIQQISVFVENQPGTLAEVLAVFKEHEVNLRALAVADTSDFGILRIIVNEPEKVERILRGAGLTVKMTPVLTITIDDRPGHLHEQVQKLSAAGINIEYMYAFATANGSDARVVLKVDDLSRADSIVRGEVATKHIEDEDVVPNFYW
jgi:hypothetical protein